MIAVNFEKRIHTYNGFTPLRVNRSFKSGTITQILGISGVGKTTFLKVLAGLIKPEIGKIIVNDQTWLDSEAGISLEPQLRRVGFVFQDYALFPHMTVEEQLLYGTSDREYIDHLLKIGRMEPYVRQKPRELSGGQQQRLAILRALSTKPRVVLMDEPFSALDKALKSVVIKDLRLLFTSLETTCLVVTHDPFKEGEFADDTFEME